MARKLDRQHEAHGSLDFAGTERLLLVGASQGRGLGGDTLEDVVDEGVHDLHRLARQGQALVDLLEGAVDVRGPRALGLAGGALLLGDGGLLHGHCACCWIQ
eukprot:362345_1